MSTVLAVDGGNSKTDLAIVDLDGTVLAAVRGPGSSPHHVGVAGSVARISALLEYAPPANGFRSFLPWRSERLRGPARLLLQPLHLGA